ncbi:hypothetical protein IFM89_038859 [Coptis chinensis]|uniref:Uncharacterized protein n=1 Tax=Coptis chinensis TaxID=261450 RepID=A0A835I8H5_9MAGN|nr:hypothetical protein IFM89_038859 [Coptis chinensis]
MKSKKLAAVREIGQLPLPSSFIFKPSIINSCKDTDQEALSKTKQQPKKSSCISLSDFLNRKLEKKDFTQPKTVQKPFSLVGEGRDVVGVFDDECIGVKRGVKNDSCIDETVFRQFIKHSRIEKEQCDGPSSGNEVGESETTPEEKDSRQWNPFRVSSTGGEQRPAASKHLLILGDDPKPKPKRRRDATFVLDEKQKPLYNHYANGSGWWDCGMEGVDSEEIGCSDAWEGMGATTNLGGLEWH